MTSQPSHKPDGERTSEKFTLLTFDLRMLGAMVLSRLTSMTATKTSMMIMILLLMMLMFRNVGRRRETMLKRQNKDDDDSYY